LASQHDSAKEPMLSLLITVALIYFILGQNNEAYFMLAAIITSFPISFLPRQPQRQALEALEKIDLTKYRL
jgi:Ca2+-transporting ATPase